MRVLPCLLALLFAFILLPALPAAASGEQVKGSLVIVGGGLEDDDSEVFKSFISMACRYRGKKPDAIKVCILPAGSASPAASAGAFRKALSAYGVPAGHIEILPIAMVDDPSTYDVDESKWSVNAYRADVIRAVEMCDAVWFVGGDQMRYDKTLFEKEGSMTPVLRAIRYALKSGAVLGGTSAGAAIMSNPMISGGDSFSALQRGAGSGEADKGVSLMRGAGFFTYGTVDQHFSQRGRLGRLIVAASAAGGKLAFGVDEDTAMVVDFAEEKITAAGRGTVTVVNLERARIYTGKAGIEARDVLVSSMESGDSYWPKRNELSPLERTAAEIPDGPEKKTVEGPVFEKLREIMVFELGSRQTREVAGLLASLISEEKASGFLVRFRKESDSRIWSGTKNGGKSGAAFNVHVDIIPVDMDIKTRSCLQGE